MVWRTDNEIRSLWARLRLEDLKSEVDTSKKLLYQFGAQGASVAAMENLPNPPPPFDRTVLETATTYL